MIGLCLSPIKLFAFSDKCIALLDLPVGKKHQEKVFQVLKQNIKKCKTCEIKNFPIYDSVGHLEKSLFLSQIKSAGQSCRILHLSWNIEYSSEFDDVIKALQSAIQEGHLIVAAAGSPTDNKISAPVDQTVMGKVKDAILIAELDQKNKQSINSFFGKEILTALHPPDNLSGSSFSSPLFSAKLLVQLNKKTNAQWLAHFNQVKSKSPNLWPSLDEFFK